MNGSDSIRHTGSVCLIQKLHSLAQWRNKRLPEESISICVLWITNRCI